MESQSTTDIAANELEREIKKKEEALAEYTELVEKTTNPVDKKYYESLIQNLKVPPKLLYSDNNLIIISGALINAKKIGIATSSQKSILGDAIKFIAIGEDSHFIQFVTHQYPDMFEFNRNKKAQWEAEGNIFTKDITTPCWRVDGNSDWKDAIKPSPYYEVHGAYEKYVASNGMQALAIYDEPGTTMQSEERIIFNTFLIKKDRVICEFPWSRQRDESFQLFYQHGVVRQINQLPDWALLAIKEDCFLANNSDDGEQLLYEVPPFLNKDITSDNLKDDEDYKKALKASFLLPTQKWVTTAIIPALFPDGSILKDSNINAINEKEENTPFLEKDSRIVNTSYKSLYTREQYAKRTWLPLSEIASLYQFFDETVTPFLLKQSIQTVMPNDKYKFQSSNTGWQVFHMKENGKYIAVLHFQSKDHAVRAQAIINKADMSLRAIDGKSENIDCVIIVCSSLEQLKAGLIKMVEEPIVKQAASFNIKKE